MERSIDHGTRWVVFKPNGVSIKETEFAYSPCLHIKTFRVAEKYGPAIEPFKRGLKEAFARRPSG